MSRLQALAASLLAGLALGAFGCETAGASNDAGMPDAQPADAGACAPDAAPPCLTVDDAGVSHGCKGGGMGPGDRDDGGGLANAGPPDGSADAMNLPFGAQCLNNGQCHSDICFLYRVKGQFCTQVCRCDADCAPPSPGCGGMGVCRVGN